jgi:uncharacterized protein (TIRG00374 family)
VVQLGVGIAISAVFLWLAFRDVAFADVWASMRSASPLGLLVVAAAGLLGIVSRGQRWVPLFRKGTGVTFTHAFAAQAIGFAGNTVLPFRAGEPLKAYALSQRTHQSFTKVLATVVLERVFDLMGVGATLGLAMWLVPIPESAGAQVGGAVRVLSIVAAATVVGIVAFVFLRQRMLRVVDAVVDRLPAAAGRPLHTIVHAFADGLDALGNARQLLRVIALTAWVWAMLAMPFAVMSMAFGFGSTYGASAWQVGIVCAAIVAVFVMIPAAPGFVGTYQAGCIVSLAIFGVPREEALAFSLLVHFLSLAPVTVIGLILAFRQGVMGGSRPHDGGQTPAPGDSQRPGMV